VCAEKPVAVSPNNTPYDPIRSASKGSQGNARSFMRHAPLMIVQPVIIRHRSLANMWRCSMYCRVWWNWRHQRRYTIIASLRRPSTSSLQSCQRYLIDQFKNRQQLVVIALSPLQVYCDTKIEIFLLSLGKSFVHRRGTTAVVAVTTSLLLTWWRSCF